MAFEALKDKQSATWGSAPYDRVSAQHLQVLEQLLDALEIKPGMRLLDVATGTGELARPAARRGLQVTGVDFAPGLIDVARTVTEFEGLDVSFDVGDAEALPYRDAAFDVVTSGFGVIFAPDQHAAASELARVTAPGGQLGLTAWLHGGAVNRMFAVQRTYMPPPPDGAGSPFDWGRRDHVQSLLSDAFDLDITLHVAPQLGPDGAAMWRLMSRSYGPTKALAESLEPESREAFQRDFAAFFDAHRDERGWVSLPREYLQIVGRRR
jgi:SAM-dependent methyltransferase